MREDKEGQRPVCVREDREGRLGSPPLALLVLMAGRGVPDAPALQGSWGSPGSVLLDFWARFCCSSWQEQDGGLCESPKGRWPLALARPPGT